MDRLIGDFRIAVRALLRRKGFAGSAILSLAIGIGATAAVFALVDALLLQSPPGITAPERVITMGRTQDGSGFDTFSYPNIEDLSASASALADVAAVRLEPSPASLAGFEGARPVGVGIVGGTFFEVLGARPHQGSFFSGEGVAEDAAVVVLSHTFWSEWFNQDPGVTGRAVVLNGSPFTVVGIAEEAFRGPFISAPDVWIPIEAAPLVGMQPELLTDRRSSWLLAVGRLAPGASLSEAEAELRGLGRQLELAYPEENQGRGVAVAPLTLFPGSFHRIVSLFMSFLFALSGLVLLVAGTNVAGMLLARVAERSKELSIRAAIGASRLRLAGHLAAECLVLFVAGGALGLVLANGILAGLLRLVPRLPIQIAVEPTIDLRVVAFVSALSGVGGLLASLSPAILGSRGGGALDLRGRSTSRPRQRARTGLLIAQIAFSTTLLLAAGLLARAVATAEEINPGFDASGVHVATFDLSIAEREPDGGLALLGRLEDAAAAIPGVESVAASRMLPLDGGGFGLGPIEVAGRPAPDPDVGWDADWNLVSPEYFTVMRMPILRGRAFSTADRTGAPDVAIINETLAGNLWPDEDPIGRTFRNRDRQVTVIGVARDAKYRSLGEPDRNFVYVPLVQRYDSDVSLLMRTRGDVAPGEAVRRMVAEVHRGLPILNQETLEEHTALGLFPYRMALRLSGGLGAVALLLTVIGIYGMVAFSVTQRTREIGIRLALGARRSSVLRMVLGQSLAVVGAGTAIGLIGTAGLGRSAESLLYGVPATDLIVMGGTTTLLIGVALLASWTPARRAARVDPMETLRAE